MGQFGAKKFKLWQICHIYIDDLFKIMKYEYHFFQKKSVSKWTKMI